MSELLPCPLCGGEAGSGWLVHNSVKIDTFQVGCGVDCNCCVEEQTEEKAIKAWNTRHSDSCRKAALQEAHDYIVSHAKAWDSLIIDRINAFDSGR